jgi:hypothetical protein
MTMRKTKKNRHKNSVAKPHAYLPASCAPCTSVRQRCTCVRLCMNYSTSDGAQYASSTVRLYRRWHASYKAANEATAMQHTRYRRVCISMQLNRTTEKQHAVQRNATQLHREGHSGRVDCGLSTL